MVFKVKKKPVRISAIARKRRDLRKGLWPKLDDGRLWLRKDTSGWLSVPRAMPLLMQIMDSLSIGKPVSATYLDLWCRTWDDSLVIANKSREMAFYAGYTGERAVRTWASRINILKDNGFIDVKEGPNGDISYVLLYNPFLIIKEKYEDGEVNDAFYNSLIQHTIDMKINDLD